MKLILKDEVLRVIEESVGETCDEIREKPLFGDDFRTNGDEKEL